MKQYIKVNNPGEMKKLFHLYDQLQWRANVSGLKYQIGAEKIYPVVVGYSDGYSWYINDHGNDGKTYLTVNQAVNMNNILSYEKMIHIPYHSRTIDQFKRPKLAMHRLREIVEAGVINSEDLSVKYVESSSREGQFISPMGGGLSHAKFECKIKSFKVKNFPTIISYQDVGCPNFSAGKRTSNHMSTDFWEVVIGIRHDYESISNTIVHEKYLQVTDLTYTDPVSGCCPSVKLAVGPGSKPSYYLYYTLFL